jgi:hypothetical protein
MPFSGNFTSGGGGSPATAQPRIDEFGALTADADAIITSFATTTSPDTRSGAELNGIIGAGEMDPPRGITISTTSDAATYNTTDPIVITGTFQGAVQTAEITLTQANGNETIETGKTFSTITSVAFPAQLTTNGAFTVGVGTRIGLRHPPVQADSGLLYADARYAGALDLGGTALKLGVAASPPNGAIDFGVLMDGEVLGATYTEDLS